MQFYNPSLDEITVSDICLRNEHKNILLIFFHGLGDIVMFLPSFQALKQKFPDVNFKLGLQENMSYEDICPDAVFLNHKDPVNNKKCRDFDCVFIIEFWMSEDNHKNMTKSELCCQKELGIEYPKDITKLPEFDNNICCVHFNTTAIPSLSVPQNMASYIWHDVIHRNLIPIECHFQHLYHNSINKKYDFINASTRGCVPKISSLISLISRSRYFIGGNSGPFHIACSVLPPKRILFLNTRYSSKCYNNLDIINMSPDDDYDKVLNEFFIKSV